MADKELVIQRHQKWGTLLLNRDVLADPPIEVRHEELHRNFPSYITDTFLGGEPHSRRFVISMQCGLPPEEASSDTMMWCKELQEPLQFPVARCFSIKLSYDTSRKTMIVHFILLPSCMGDISSVQCLQILQAIIRPRITALLEEFHYRQCRCTSSPCSFRWHELPMESMSPKKCGECDIPYNIKYVVADVDADKTEIMPMIGMMAYQDTSGRPICIPSPTTSAAFQPSMDSVYNTLLNEVEILGQMEHGRHYGTRYDQQIVRDRMFCIVMPIMTTFLSSSPVREFYIPSIATRPARASMIGSELFMFCAGDSDVQILHAFGNHTWDANAKTTNGHIAPSYGNEFRNRFGRILPPYHRQHFPFTGYNQIGHLLHQLKTEKNVVVPISLFGVYTRHASPPPCGMGYIVEKRNRHISLIVIYRSSDTVVGLPHNINSAVYFLNHLATFFNLVPLTVKIILQDAHIYNQHDNYFQPLFENVRPRKMIIYREDAEGVHDVVMSEIHTKNTSVDREMKIMSRLEKRFPQHTFTIDGVRVLEKMLLQHSLPEDALTRQFLTQMLPLFTIIDENVSYEREKPHNSYIPVRGRSLKDLVL